MNAILASSQGVRWAVVSELTPNVATARIRFLACVERRSSAAFPSACDQEWYSDVILANAHALDARPEGSVPIRYNYPRPGVEISKTLKQRGPQRALHNCDTVLLQQFSDTVTASGSSNGMHWHNLALIGPEKVAVYWEPYGSQLPGRGVIAAAFDDALKADGWELISVRLEVQTDGYQCGPWAQCAGRVRTHGTVDLWLTHVSSNRAIEQLVPEASLRLRGQRTLRHQGVPYLPPREQRHHTAQWPLERAQGQAWRGQSSADGRAACAASLAHAHGSEAGRAAMAERAAVCVH